MGNMNALKSTIFSVNAMIFIFLFLSAYYHSCTKRINIYTSTNIYINIGLLESLFNEVYRNSTILRNAILHMLLLMSFEMFLMFWKQ